MATPEQIEAVVREIDGYEPYSSPYLLTKTDATRLAARAIAAYERARPVVSDEELVDVLQRARSLHHFGEADGFVGPRDPDWMKGMIAGIRAVRERLEGRGLHNKIAISVAGPLADVETLDVVYAVASPVARINHRPRPLRCRIGWHRERDISTSCHYVYECEICGERRPFNPYMEF